MSVDTDSSILLCLFLSCLFACTSFTEIPDTGHYRTASAIPWARKQVISGFLAQGSGRSFSIMTGVRTLWSDFLIAELIYYLLLRTTIHIYLEPIMCVYY